MNNKENDFYGWCNYATWKVFDEMAVFYINDTAMNYNKLMDAGKQSVWRQWKWAEKIQEYVEAMTIDMIDEQDIDMILVRRYAKLFLQDVNYWQLAEHALSKCNVNELTNVAEKSDEFYVKGKGNEGLQ